MSNFSVRLDDKQWKDLMGRIRLSLRNPIPKLAALATTQGYADVIDHFRQEEGPDGRWDKRTPFTQETYKIRHKTDKRYDPGNKILQLTGNMRQNVELGKKSKRYRMVDKQTIELFVDPMKVPYAHKHNDGLDGNKKRTFMWLSEKAGQKIASSFAEWLAEGR